MSIYSSCNLYPCNLLSFPNSILSHLLMMMTELISLIQHHVAAERETYQVYPDVGRSYRQPRLLADGAFTAE